MLILQSFDVLHLRFVARNNAVKYPIVEVLRVQLPMQIHNIYSFIRGEDIQEPALSILGSSRSA
jgi:hypothetical protein